MKSFIAILLIIVFFFSIAGCKTEAEKQAEQLNQRTKEQQEVWKNATKTTDENFKMPDDYKPRF